MKRIPILLLVVIILPAKVFSQIDTTLVRLAGLVEPSDTMQQELAYVHVINLRNGKGTITDSLGLFHLNIHRQDTILFKSLGFADSKYVLPDTIQSSVCFIHVKLSAVAYQLEVIDVIALSRQHQFRYDFVHLQLPQNDWEKQLIIPGVTKGDYQTIRDEERVYKPDIGSPVSFLYVKLSKKEQSRIKLQELKDHDKIVAQIERKFNKQQLMRFTGYNDSVVFLFIRFLDYTEAFLLETCEYDLYVDISKKMLEFEHLNQMLFRKETGSNP